MRVAFEWDALKAKRNLVKHGVPFEEATEIFGDPLSMTIADPLHSDAEDRWVTMGLSRKGRLLVVVHADRGDRVRLISARPATRKEKRCYEER